jgi:hypothetical protein
MMGILILKPKVALLLAYLVLEEWEYIDKTCNTNIVPL